MIRPGTLVQVRDNEPNSLFGPIYNCTIAYYHPEIGLTVKYGDRNLVCIDLEKQSPLLTRKLMDYIVSHVQCGSIINMGTMRQIQIDVIAEAFDYQPADIAHQLRMLPHNPQCAFAENDRA